MNRIIDLRTIRRKLLSPRGIAILVLVSALGAFLLVWERTSVRAPTGAAGARGPGGPAGASQPVPVTAATARQQAMPVWVNAQGTVIPRNYVSVMPRVAGLLQSVNFKEGQVVKAGDLLATIDPRPFRLQVGQAQGQLLRDQAQLSGAESDLERYELLLKQDSISGQQVADQRATVAQLKGAVAVDKAALDNAQLQLEWTRITAPNAGVVGLRQVDVGNMVGTTGAIGGGASALTGTASTASPIVTIAQLRPITVTFPVAQVQLPAILERMHKAELPVEVWDQRRSAQLDSGKVLAIDNQVNVSTGTVLIKAECPNARLALFPNQFVNVRMLLDTLQDAVVVPSAAIALGASGSYVYVIDANNKVAVRQVVPGPSNQDYTAVSSGLKPGERVVTDGLDRLKDGSTVEIVGAYGGKPVSEEQPTTRPEAAAQSGARRMARERDVQP